MNEAPLGLLFGALAALLLVSGFFSGSETGMMALNRYRLRHLKKTGHRGARKASKLLEEPETLISTILIGNNVANNLAAALVTVLAIRMIGDNAVVPASLLLTLLMLIFAEILPKTIAAYKPERIAFPVSFVLTPLKSLLYPIIWTINHFTRFVLRLTGVESKNQTEHITVDELRTIVSEAGHLIPKRHQGMLLNILELEDVSVDDIMIPRNEVFGIDTDDDVATILEKLRSSEFTRMPVFEQDINNIIGVLHQRDVINSVNEHGQVDRERLLGLVKPPYFVPEGTPLNTQLINFQKHKQRLGIVVDEYGVVQGIITLEDLLEEIVGEFTSNLLEENSQDIVAQSDGSHVIDGTTTIRDINKGLDWELPTDGPKTLNGLLLEHLESFPEGLVCVRLGRYHFEVLEMHDKMIQEVRVEAASKKKRRG